MPLAGAAELADHIWQERYLLGREAVVTLELTGRQRHSAARRTLTSTARGGMPLRVRVERPVSHSHRAARPQLPRPA